MFSKLFSLLMLFCIGATFINAQSYYEVGKVYTFKGASTDGTREVELSITFDEKGLVTATRKDLGAAVSGNKFYTLTSPNAISTTQNTAKIVKESTYWLISFDEGTPTVERRGGVEYKFSCNCKNAGTCELVWVSTGSTCVDCIPTDNCRKCKLTITPIPSSSGFVGTSMILVEAVGVSIDK